MKNGWAKSGPVYAIDHIEFLSFALAATQSWSDGPG